MFLELEKKILPSVGRNINEASVYIATGHDTVVGQKEAESVPETCGGGGSRWDVCG